jgi:hypothetical protein
VCVVPCWYVVTVLKDGVSMSDKPFQFSRSIDFKQPSGGGGGINLNGDRGFSSNDHAYGSTIGGGEGDGDSMQDKFSLEGRDLFEVSELRAQLTAAQTGDRLSNLVWSCCADSW